MSLKGEEEAEEDNVSRLALNPSGLVLGASSAEPCGARATPTGGAEPSGARARSHLALNPSGLVPGCSIAEPFGARAISTGGADPRGLVLVVTWR